MISEEQEKEIDRFLTWFKGHSRSWQTFEKWDSPEVNPHQYSAKESVLANSFVVPALKNYFLGDDFLARYKLNLEEAKRGLAIEYRDRAKDGLKTPQRKLPHLLNKGEAFQESPPECWFDLSQTAKTRLASPDFAIKSPLPFNLIGELKLFKGHSRAEAERAIFQTIREVVFYLGAYCGEYEGAIIVAGDASSGQYLCEAWDLFSKSMAHALGVQSGIFGCVVPIPTKLKMKVA